MLPTDKRVWMVALAVLHRHGKGAAAMIEHHHKTASAKEDRDEARIWAQVGAAVDELLKERPDHEEWLQ